MNKILTGIQVINQLLKGNLMLRYKINLNIMTKNSGKIYLKQENLIKMI